MKTRNKIIIIAALCLAGFVLGACGNAEDADNQGSIIINFGNAGVRAASYNPDLTGMIYTIKLTSPGKATINKPNQKGDKPISISVSEGIWNIDVSAEGDRLRGKGENTVTVIAGKSASAEIGMTITGTRVSSWAELVEDFNELNVPNGKLKELDNIEIVKDLDASTGLGSSITTQTVTLWAKKDVNITRSRNQNGAPVFTITNCTLILDGTKGGEIKIEGNGRDNTACQRALINVEDNSTLRMLNGVTLTNNHTTNFGGGVYVRDGKFYMEGGTISGNTANENGGGVYIDGRSSSKQTGVLIKTGGIIYGSDADVASDKKNIANTRDGGDAVYDKGTPYNGTLYLNYP